MESHTPMGTDLPPSVVHRVTQSQTRLKRLSMHACIGEGNGNALQYSCLDNPRDREAWPTAVHGVAKSCTQVNTHTLCVHFESEHLVSMSVHKTGKQPLSMQYITLYHLNDFP